MGGALSGVVARVADRLECRPRNTMPHRTKSGPVSIVFNPPSIGIACMVLLVACAGLPSSGWMRRSRRATPRPQFASRRRVRSRLPTRSWHQPHRKRETVLGPMAGAPGVAPTVTEVAGELTRQIFEYDLPKLGHMRVERVTCGSRVAVRTIAPGVVEMLAKAKRTATVQSARSLINQVFSAVAAVQTGGLSSAGSIQQLLQAASTLKSAADARRLLGEAEQAFGSWQLVPDDADEDDDLPALMDGPDSVTITFSGTVKTKRGEARRFKRRPAQTFPGMPTIVETLLIDAATGVLLSEETSMNGQAMMRTEYFDVGAAISIELPDCLRK